MIFDLPPEPPKLWLPAKPAIIRPAEHSLLRPGAFAPVSRAERRAIVADLVKSKRLTPREAARAIFLVPVTGWLTGAPYPVIQTTNSGNNGTSRGTTTTVTYPTGIAVGDVVILVVTTENSASITNPSGSGFTQLSNTASSSVTMLVSYQVAASALSGTFNVTTGNARTSWAILRIDGRQGNPEAGTAATGSGTSPNPPSLTPSWGSASTLWLSIVGFGGSTSASRAVSSYPSSYVLAVESAGTTSNSSTMIGVGYRNLAATSDDPGTYTTTPTDPWVAQTVAIRSA